MLHKKKDILAFYIDSLGYDDLSIDDVDWLTATELYDDLTEEEKIECDSYIA